MKIKLLRLLHGCSAFKGAAVVVAEKGTTISRMEDGSGSYAVNFLGTKKVVIESHRVDFAEPADDRVPVADLKK